ncbi:MAG: hypothetical protein QOK48_315, partial [Blastocatellia bacterium]|nr:hypothetical protein [Blastocatellia bacterium]
MAPRCLLLLVCLCYGGVTCHVLSQTAKPSPPPPDDVVRINTELVQTNVMVFDKQGHFVDGLKQEQFELTVDGKTQPIYAFEQVRAGSARETKLLAGGNGPEPSSEKAAANADRGRTVIFFIDDLHLSLDSLGRTRKALAHFIDTEMNENDRVAIASTSG